ncbi:MAG TPA: VOC family protein [Hyphomicrobiaceae bacterium]|nr:VOC family protein [Hyphomicrobiaceae bacterium]
MSTRPRLVPELAVTDIVVSRRFWCQILGFKVLYERPEDGFAYLDLDGAEIMLDQRDGGAPERVGIWDTGPMERPFGRGINFQIRLTDYDATLARVRAAAIAIHFGPEERWYRRGDEEVGVKQFLVLDPDGYIVRLQQIIGRRPRV